MSHSTLPRAIPFLDLKTQYLSIKDEIQKAIQPVLDSCAFSGGPFVEAFEKEFAAYSEAAHAVGVSNGTDAIHLAMRALDIGPGDEVIVPANTFIATAWGPSHAGATPVFVDCTADTWNIDPAKIAAKVTSRTKAIIGVHLYGQPFDVDAVRSVARDHNLLLIEDCAQSQGARHKGKRVGGLAEMGCFSFYPGKNLGAYGEAGGITTQNDRHVKRLRGLRNHGSEVRYQHDEIGFNMRMDGIQGAILSVKLRHLDDWNRRRQAIARRYQQEIRSPRVQLQRQPEGIESVYHLFVAMADERDRFMKHLGADGIAPGLHYPIPCHLQKAYASLGHRRGDYPNAEALADRCVSLPMYPELSDEDVSRVIDSVNRY